MKRALALLVSALVLGAGAACRDNPVCDRVLHGLCDCPTGGSCATELEVFVCDITDGAQFDPCVQNNCCLVVDTDMTSAAPDLAPVDAAPVDAAVDACVGDGNTCGG